MAFDIEMNLTIEQKKLQDLGAYECTQNSPHHIYTVGKHTEEVVRFCIEHNGGEELIKAAWLHDAGKMQAKRQKGDHDTFFGHPRISARIAVELGESDYVVKLVLFHDAAIPGQLHASYEELASFGEQWCEDLILLMNADLAAQHPTYQIERKQAQRDLFIRNLRAAQKVLIDGQENDVSANQLENECCQH